MHNKLTETKQCFKALVTEEVLHRRTGDGHFLQVFIQCPCICIYLHTVKQPADSISEKVWTEPKPVSDFLLASQGWLWMQLKREKKYFWHCRERESLLWWGRRGKNTAGYFETTNVIEKYHILKLLVLLLLIVQKKKKQPSVFQWLQMQSNVSLHIICSRWREIIKMGKGSKFVVYMHSLIAFAQFHLYYWPMPHQSGQNGRLL